MEAAFKATNNAVRNTSHQEDVQMWVNGTTGGLVDGS